MKMDEYFEKKKELQEAENKAEEIKKSLRAEKKEALKEKFDKYNFLHKLKPWTRSDILLAIFMMVLFLVAYNHGGVTDVENGEEGFFGIFGFLTKEKNESIVLEISSEIKEEEPEDVVNTTNVTIVTTEIEDEEPEEIEFDMWAKYGEDEFDTIETSLSSIVYYIVIKNNEGVPIKCESTDSDVEVEPYDSREIFNRAVQSDAGEDNKIVKEHIFTCYKVGDSINDGTEKSMGVTLIFI